MLSVMDNMTDKLCNNLRLANISLFRNAKLFYLHKWRCLTVIVLVSAQIMELIECTMATDRSPIPICIYGSACCYSILVTVLVRQIETKGFAGEARQHINHVSSEKECFKTCWLN